MGAVRSLGVRPGQPALLGAAMKELGSPSTLNHLRMALRSRVSISCRAPLGKGTIWKRWRGGSLIFVSSIQSFCGGELRDWFSLSILAAWRANVSSTVGLA